MLQNKPPVHKFLKSPWEDYQPYFQELQNTPLTAGNLNDWMLGWSWVNDLLSDVYSRLSIAYNQNTEDAAAEDAYHTFLEEVLLPAMEADQKLKLKLLESGFKPDGFDIQLREIQAEVDLFREANLPLLSKEQTLSSKYEKITSSQTVIWEDQEFTITQLTVLYQQADRGTREKMWHLANQRRMKDRDSINDVWKGCLKLRREIAQNADKESFREYQWLVFKRFDYTPEDCMSFHRAILEVMVPAATRVYERHRTRLGLTVLRPWDLDLELSVYTFSSPPLHPFDQVDALEAACADIFQRVDPVLGGYFGLMRQEKLLDLPNRRGKAPGAYCALLNISQKPFIFANVVGTHEDVQTILHEAGHAFHVFETNHLPYSQQKNTGSEFAEVASMAMELLAFPYFTNTTEGLYTPTDAARAQIEHFEQMLIFWPYMAVVDLFQHWVYTHPEESVIPATCDAKWLELWQQYFPAVDWTGMENACAAGWHRKVHIHTVPFYYIEYGLAQLGAVQVWANAQENQAAAVAAYRKALALGNTVPLPNLFETAGARFAFDLETIASAVKIIETALEKLYQIK